MLNYSITVPPAHCHTPKGIALPNLGEPQW